MRSPWTSPSNGTFSWTTTWLNLAAFITVIRFAMGHQGITLFGMEYAPGPLNSGVVAAVLASLGGLYGYRRTSEGSTASGRPSVPGPAAPSPIPDPE